MASSHTTDKTSENAPRKLESWIDTFLDFTSGTQSPEIFRKWAAISIIVGAMERKCWMNLWERILFPNMYILLTGGPGVGKTDSLREVVKFWRTIPELHIAPSSVSRASLTDSLNGAGRAVLRPTSQQFMQFNSLQVCAEEFGTFLTQYETEFMSTLNHLYDCIRYEERKRHMKEPIDIPDPQLNMIAATTPGWLGATLPESAWSEGFSSRLVMIYSGTRIKKDPFAATDKDGVLEAALVDDLRQIHNLYGTFHFAEEVVEVFRKWYYDDCPPIPTHPKLEHYLPRRHIHFLKLCMAVSASRSNDMVIEMVDYQLAMDIFNEAETSMTDVFKAMRKSGDSNVMDEVFNYVWTTYAKEGKAIPQFRIIQFISQKVPSHSVSKVLEIMVAAGMLEISNPAGFKGQPEYKPAPKALHGI